MLYTNIYIEIHMYIKVKIHCKLSIKLLCNASVKIANYTTRTHAYLNLTSQNLVKIWKYASKVILIYKHFDSKIYIN